MNFVKFLVVVNIAFAHLLASAAYGDMDPATCEPSGMSNKLKEKMDPKGFWARMYVDSASAIQLHLRGDPEIASATTVEDCEVMYMRKPIEAQKCVWRIQNTINYWSKCNQHAKRMCRINGGYC